MGTITAERTKTMLLEAFDALFNRRDFVKAAEYWSESYIQHSAHIPPGRDGLFNLVRTLPNTSRYENDHIMVEGDWAMMHGRFSGNGAPRAWIACDILRIENGRLAEHWDVLQDEATQTESKSGLPMFGTSFAAPDPPSAAPASLTVEEARRITAPLYDALNQPAKKDPSALLARACNDDYKSYSTNENFLTREQLADVFTWMGSVVPDLNWEVKDMMTIGDRIIVRGKATGTPTGDFWGQKPTGKGFDTMAIDVFTVRDGKLASAYHIENWAEALQQMNKSLNRLIVAGAAFQSIIVPRPPSITRASALITRVTWRLNAAGQRMRSEFAARSLLWRLRTFACLVVGRLGAGSCWASASSPTRSADRSRRR